MFVIKKVISYTSRLADLKNLRLVSAEWNNLILPKLLKNSIVTFKSWKEMTRYENDFGLRVAHKNFHWKGTGIDLNDALMQSILHSAEELHFSKGLITEDDLLIILKSGLCLKTLSFNEVFVEKEQDIPDNEAENKAKETRDARADFIAQNLSRLEVTSCDEDDNYPWSLVLPTLPNLNTLHAQLQSTSQVTAVLESLLTNQIKLGEFSCFLVDMNNEHLQLLSCLEMPLKVLDISLASTVASSCVEEFLASKSCQMLENLKIFKEADCGHKNYFGLPKIPSMKSLEILGDPVANIFQTINLSCPNLESLNLSEVSCKDVMSQKYQHLKLKSLCIEECFFPTNVLTKLAETFPNLTKLCLFLNDENIGTIFQKFEQLEELTILGTEISDDGLTGGKHHGGRNDRPYIGDCKKLRVLNLYPQPLHGITDDTILQGLFFVPELTSFSAPETAISDKGLRTLLRIKPNMVKLTAKCFALNINIVFCLDSIKVLNTIA
ncbi:F-box/LRR-repeat protein 12 [Orchesella cincta]|uniref:F-box/LRR-repeat protein 12 n=1 Tax=Orchesella cincta TaxID=48709 RepID=A0A1D2N3F5_ORCCI|nr:F-box/LRR-repeat protein 12 [Orchesella cincta]